MASESTKLDMQQAEPMTEREVDEAVTHAAANPAQADRQQVPDGHVLVPVKPTQEMMDAAMAYVYKHGFTRGAGPGAVYAAMLAAAPEAPAQASAVDEREAGVFSEFNACMHRETCRAALVGTDRHVLQAKGKHPAPCAKFCESKAYEIDARSLRAQIEVLEHYRKVYGQVSGILACVAETGPIEPGDEITVRRLKMLVQDFEALRGKAESAASLLQPLRGEMIVTIARQFVPKTLGLHDVPQWVVPFVRAIERTLGIGVEGQR